MIQGVPKKAPPALEASIFRDYDMLITWSFFGEMFWKLDNSFIIPWTSFLQIFSIFFQKE